MLGILTALAMLAAAADGSGTAQDKTVHSCPAGYTWEEVAGWEIGSLCEDENGYTWKWDGQNWVPAGYTWSEPATDGYTW